MSFQSLFRSLGGWINSGPPASSSIPDIGQVRGQQSAKLAALIAAAGRHNLLLLGPPGEGKSLLSASLPSILPPLSRAERRYLRSIGAPLVRSPITSDWCRPYRSIGPTITAPSLLGGGRSRPVPGELALASYGVLLIDEFPQFARSLLDLLRGPIEDRQYSVTRGGVTTTFVSDVLLVLAANPCPCGYYPSPQCRCSSVDRGRYLSRLSGPLMDRIDLQATCEALTSAERFAAADLGQSERMLRQVLAAQIRQYSRNPGSVLNSALGPSTLFSRSANPLLLSPGAWAIVDAISATGRLSTRAVGRLVKCSRTVADLHGSPSVESHHVDMVRDYIGGASGILSRSWSWASFIRGLGVYSMFLGGLIPC